MPAGIVAHRELARRRLNAQLLEALAAMAMPIGFPELAVEPVHVDLTRNGARRGEGDNRARCARAFRRASAEMPAAGPSRWLPPALNRRPTASTEVVDFWLLVAFGSATDVKRRFGVEHPRRVNSDGGSDWLWTG
jgi:hypothetical protein